MNDVLSAYLAAFAGIAAVIWAAIRGLQKMTRLSDRFVAGLVATLGILCGVVAQGCGLVAPTANTPWSWIGSGLFGLLAALAGAGTTDLNMTALTAPPKGNQP